MHDVRHDSIVMGHLCLTGLIGVTRRSGRQRFCDPSGVAFNDGRRSGGVASLNPRLISGTPAGVRVGTTPRAPLRAFLARTAFAAF